MIYSYLTFPAFLVQMTLRAEPVNPVLPEDALPIQVALATGYRWVRTDRDLAIFEKVTGTLTEREAWLLNDVSYLTRTSIDSVQYMELQALARKLASWRARQ